MDAGRRRLRDQRPPLRPDHAPRRRGRSPSWATTCRSRGGTASERYGEKLATPDTSVGDLIGDVDPIKVAEGRTLGDPETIHYGLVPRTNRGIFAVNELPDLAERIQVSLLNVLEERDIQVRGYALRLPLDLLLVGQRQPRGLHQPRPHHHPAQGPLRRRDPHPLPARARPTSSRSIRQEADAAWPSVPDHLLEVLARFTRAVRESPAVDQRSGVSARFAIAAAETVAAAALRRAACAARTRPVARVGDLDDRRGRLRGKVEFEAGEEGREKEILDHLLRKATAETVRAAFRGLDLVPLVAALDGRRARSPPGSWSPQREFLQRPPGARRIPPLRRASVSAWARQTTGSAPPPSNLPWKVSTSPGGSPRTPTTRRRSTGRQFAGQAVLRLSTGGPMSVHNRSRYGRYAGGPDPLAPPVDVAEALDAVAEDVMAGYSPRHALQEFLRRGGRNREASTTSPAGFSSGAVNCWAATGWTAPSTKSRSCSTPRCWRNASSSPATP